MRHAIHIAAFGVAAVGFACHDGGEPGLRQVTTEAGFDPADGAASDVSGDASSSDGVDGTGTPDDADATDIANDTGPIGCTSDEACASARACQVGRCEAGTCVFAPAADGTRCDDADPCSLVDTCQGGACAGSGLLACVDDDPCTEDRCAPGRGCEFAAKTCDDGDACTEDACREGVGCVATPLTCPGSRTPCNTSRCDPTVGCIDVPSADGAACDDGDPCTSEVCSGGACAASPIACDDGNACTTDACLPVGGCTFGPIPNCANDEACIGRLSGDACDDRDPATSGDLCLIGSCRGFSLTRVPGSTVEGQEGLVITEVDHGASGTGGWMATFWTIDFILRQRHALADITSPASPTVFTDTLQDAAFAGLHGDLVGDADGRLWQLIGGGWTTDNGWDEALDDSGRGAVSALFGVQDVKPGSALAPRRLWAAGDDDGAWIRHCREEGDRITCSEQRLGGDAASVPVAVSGVARCEPSGACSGAWLALGADAAVGGGFSFTDTWENASGVLGTWTAGRLPETAANRATRAVAAFTSDAGPRALVVGDNGYLLHRRGGGGWSSPLVLREGQQSRDFSGVWVGAGVIIVSAHRVAPNNQTALELWVAPIGSDLESGESWVVHELGRFPNVDADGLYDVHGLPTGEVRAVGAVRRTGGAFDWLDGAIWVRQ